MNFDTSFSSVALSGKAVLSKARRYRGGALLAGVLLAAILSVLPASPAVAQGGNSPEAAKGPQLEEVVVTARRVLESMQDVSLSVTSLSNSDLQNNVILDVQDLPSATPSLHIGSSQGQANNPIISIRGQVQNDSSVLTLDPSVGVYLDEVYLGRTQGSLLDLFDISSVEVLKGPQGTLFGRNTTGGAILITSKKADLAAGWEGFARAGAGNHGQRTLEGAMNLPVWDRMAFRVAYSQREREGYGTQLLYSQQDPSELLEERDSGDKDSVTWRAHGLWNVTERFELEVGYDTNDFDSIGTPIYDPSGDRATTDVAGQINGFERSSDDHYTFATDVPTKTTADLKGLNVSGLYEFPWFSVKLIHAQREVDYFFLIDVDGTSARGAQFSSGQVVDQTSTELHFLGSLFDERFEYIFGLYDFEEDGHEESNVYVSEIAAAALGAPAPPSFPPGSIPIVDRSISADILNESQSAFVHATYHIFPSLTINAGVRRVKDTKGIDMSSFDSGALNQAIGPRSEDPLHLNTIENCIYFPRTEGATNDGENCRLRRSDDFSFTLWGGGVEWSPWNDTMVYLRANRGARSGGQNFRGFNEETLKPFEPEFVQDMELGVKTEFFDRRVRVNLAVFKGDYKDFQFSEAILPVTVVKNVGDAIFEGAEIEAKALITENLKLTASGSYLDFEYDDEALVPIHSPERTWSVGANYNWPFSWGAANFNVNYGWHGKTNMDIKRSGAENNPLAVEEGYKQASARIAVNITDWGLEIAAFGNNLTDEEYQSNFLAQFIKPNPNEHAVIDAGRPRFYGINITKEFGL